MPVNEEKRQEIRVPLPVRLGFNVLKSRQDYIRSLTTTTAALETDTVPPTLDGEDQLEAWLNRLDQKLNLVISLLADNIGRKEYSHQARVIDLSESGVRLISPVRLHQGAILEIGLGLPGQTYRTLDIAAQVIWSEESRDSAGGREFAVGLTFVDVLPQDQDVIVHYIFQKQREDIRRKRAEEDE
jgi:hypothetical protein